MFPEIHLAKTLILPTYLVYLSLLYSFLLLILPRWAQVKSLPARTALNVALVIMVFGFIGARLFHVFFENLSFYQGHWERVFYFGLGGFVYFGGAISAFLASVIYLRLAKQPVAIWLDFFAPILALGYGLGRVSCFLTGCCYGLQCDLPWAIDGRHPTQLYAVFWELTLCLALWWLGNRRRIMARPGVLFSLWVFFHAVGRLIMETYRDDFRGSFYWGFSISTWVCLLLMSLSINWLCYEYTLRKSPDISG